MAFGFGGIAGAIAGDPTQAYQKSRERYVDLASTDALGNFVGMFGNQNMPAQPGGMPIPGTQSPPGLQAGSSSPSGPAGGPATPPASPGLPAGQSQPPAPVPGARPMGSILPGGAQIVGAGGQGGPPVAQSTPPAPGVPPPQPQASGPPTGQGQPQGGQPPAYGGMSLQQLMAGIARSNPNQRDPAVLAAAVMKAMPLLNAQGREDALAMREWIVQQQQAGLNQRTLENIEGRQNVADTNVTGRQNVADTNAASRLAVAGMKPDVALLAQYDQEHPDSTPEERARFYEQTIKGGATKQAIAAGHDTAAGERTEANIAGRAANTQANIESREKIAQLRADTQVEVKKMNDAARRELAEFLEGKKDARADMSANLRRELAKLNNDARAELTNKITESREKVAAGAQEGAMAREKSREEAAGQRSNESIAARVKTAEETQNRIDQRAAKTEAGRQSRFERTQGHRELEDVIHNDQRYQILKQNQERIANQMITQKDRSQLNQWRAVLDAQHKAATEAITSAGNMDEDERKQFLAQENKFYQDRIMEVGRAMGDRPAAAAPASTSRATGPVKVQTPEEATKLAPGTHYITPDGIEMTR